MRSTKKEVVNKIRQHIKDCVYSCEGEEFETAKEAAAVLKKEFERVTNNQVSISHWPNIKERFQYYMEGIPFHFEYATHEQAEKIREWLGDDGKKYTSVKIGDMYYSLIYREMNALLR